MVWPATVAAIPNALVSAQRNDCAAFMAVIHVSQNIDADKHLRVHIHQARMPEHAESAQCGGLVDMAAATGCIVVHTCFRTSSKSAAFCNAYSETCCE